MLTIAIQNDGWGAARNIHGSVSEPLCRLFPMSSATQIDAIDSGIIAKNAFSFCHHNIDQRSFDVLLQEHKNRTVNEADILGSSDRNASDGFLIDSVHVELVYKDINSSERKVSSRASTDRLSGNFGGSLHILKDCFAWHGRFVAFCMLAPSAIYYVSLDPDGEVGSRQYNISHKIPSGDVEHFSIMLGSEKSCVATVWLEFRIDNDQVVKSEKFKIRVWNPRNARHHHRYVNGDELISAHLTANEGALYSRREFQESSFPFLRQKERSELCRL
jgi:hypothetical protein